MAKPVLGALFRDSATTAHISKMMQNETDRGCALVCGAMVDEALGDLLHACLGDTKTSWDDILDGNGPLKTFSARTRVADALGILCKAERSDLDDVRAVRNRAAHFLGSETSPWDFSNDDVKLRCFRLKTFPIAEALAARAQFIGAAAMLTARFQGRAGAVRDARARSGQAEALRVAVSDALEGEETTDLDVRR